MSSVSLTPKELEVLIAIASVGKIEADWAQVAAKAEMTNAKQARDKWGLIRKKLVSGNTSTATSNETAGEDDEKKTKASGKKRKAEADDDEGAEPKKTKAKKATKGRAKKAPEEEEGVKADSGDGDDE